MTKKIYKSEALEALHETATDFFESRLLPQKDMRRFDKSCLLPVEKLDPAEIKAVREAAGASQTVFAHYLNVKPGLVSQWERGERKPSGAALKLLSLVKHKGLDCIA